eukprot:6772656-Pyramimonas_sp.AAC.1
MGTNHRGATGYIPAWGPITGEPQSLNEPLSRTSPLKRSASGAMASGCPGSEGERASAPVATTPRRCRRDTSQSVSAGTAVEM